MTTTNPRYVLLALLLVCTTALVPAGTAAVETGSADLAIEQPDYITTSVDTSTANGTTVYHVRGNSFDITPQNFQAENVVAFGVDASKGKLTYNEKFNEFEFATDTKGTYRLYWVVEYQTTVQQNNSTATVTRQQRYEALVDVEGKTDMVHMTDGSLTEMRTAANKWNEFNSSVIQDLQGRSQWVQLGLIDPMSPEEIIDSMVNAWLLVNDTLSALSGNVTMVTILLITTLGGLFLLLMAILYHTGVLAYLYGRLNQHEATEAAEGTAGEKIAHAEVEEMVRALANRDFQDIKSWDDHIAAAMRTLGETPKDAFVNWRSIIRERFALHARLQVMGQNGYVAVADEVSTDGGAATADSDSDTAYANARVVPEDEAEDAPEMQTIDLTGIEDPEHDLIDALDWQQPAIREFDYVGAEKDYDALATPVEYYELDELLKAIEVDRRQFDNDRVAGEYIVDLFQDLRESDFTDEHGVPDTLRYTLNQWLDTAHLLNDRFELPMQYDIDLVEAILADHNPRERARETMQAVKEGRLD